MPTPETLITSTANPVIRHFRSLDQKKNRDAEGLFVIEGLRYVSQALLAGWEPVVVLATPRLRQDAALRKLLAGHKATRHEVSPELLSRLTGRDNAEEIVVAFRQRYAASQNLTTGVWAGLEEIRDPGNLGTIIRTAEAAGAAGILLIGNVCDPFSPEAVKASAGSLARVPVCHMSQNEYVKWCAGYKGQIVGTRMAASADYRKATYKTNALLLMGSEHAGLSEAAARTCTDIVRIPMKGEIESLNVATATALILFEITSAL